MADARRAELLATLARSTATAAAALVEQARAYAELAQLEAAEAGVRVEVTAQPAGPANDAQPVAMPPARPVKPKAPRKRAARPIPMPDPSVKVDDVTAARVDRMMRRWKAT